MQQFRVPEDLVVAFQALSLSLQLDKNIVGLLCTMSLNCFSYVFCTCYPSSWTNVLNARYILCVCIRYLCVREIAVALIFLLILLMIIIKHTIKNNFIKIQNNQI